MQLLFKLKGSWKIKIISFLARHFYSITVSYENGVLKVKGSLCVIKTPHPVSVWINLGFRVYNFNFQSLMIFLSIKLNFLHYKGEYIYEIEIKICSLFSQIWVTCGNKNNKNRCVKWTLGNGVKEVLRRLMDILRTHQPLNDSSKREQY